METKTRTGLKERMDIYSQIRNLAQKARNLYHEHIEEIGFDEDANTILYLSCEISVASAECLAEDECGIALMKAKHFYRAAIGVAATAHRVPEYKWDVGCEDSIF